MHYEGVEGIDNARPRGAFKGHFEGVEGVKGAYDSWGRGSETDATCLCMFVSLSLN